MNKPSEYQIMVRLDTSEGEEFYEARVTELQDVVAFGATHSEAYEAALDAIAGLQEMFALHGKKLPPPQGAPIEFSGRVTLRMSKSLHAIVNSRSQADGVSLNQWIVEAVARRIDSKATFYFSDIIHYEGQISRKTDSMSVRSEKMKIYSLGTTEKTNIYHAISAISWGNETPRSLVTVATPEAAKYEQH